MEKINIQLKKVKGRPPKIKRHNLFLDQKILVSEYVDLQIFMISRKITIGFFIKNHSS